MTTNGHRPTKRQRTELRLAERRTKVFQRRVEGASLQEIADELGVSLTTVCFDEKKFLARLEEQSTTAAAQLRRMQLERCRTALAAIWPRVVAGELEAVDRLLKLLEREAKLLGLDAPARVDVEARIRALASVEGWDAEEALATTAQVARLLEAGRG